MEVDSQKVGMAFVLLIIGLLIGVAVIFLVHHEIIAPYKTECTTNPAERYAQSCTTTQDCLAKCITRLRSNSS